MGQAERLQDIQIIARRDGRLTVERSARHFDVTLQTIRRDLSELADQGRLQPVRWWCAGGMDPDIALVDLRDSDDHPSPGQQIAQPRSYSDETATRVDQAVMVLLQVAEAKVVGLTEIHRERITRLVARLEAEDNLDLPPIRQCLAPDSKVTSLTRSRTYAMPPRHPKTPESKLDPPAVVPLPAVRPAASPNTQRSHQNFDRAARGVMAKLSGGVSNHAFIEAWSDWAQHMARSPGRQLELVEHAQQNALKLMAGLLDPDAKAPFTPKPYDHRFTHPDWQKQPFRMWQQGFLATQDWWDHATEPMRGLCREDAERARFLARQTLDLISPSNFPLLNPEIIEATRETAGRNLTEGMGKFSRDMIKTLGGHRDPAPEGFEIGKDLACTEGQVVFRNDLFELIQYAPQTEQVRADPILIVPAWIMKYYILDLSPHNSMVRYLVDQGFTVFMISWCNPTAAQAELSLEDYRKRGVLAALDAVCAIVPDRPVHAVGYCLGGTMLAITAATMARDGDTRLGSITLMAAQVDFVEAGELLMFLDESQIAFLEDLMWEQGYLDRPQMARAFAAIRSEDLIYTRNVQRYFLGRDDLPSDIGVWNADSTRMPARMHSEYLRSLFLENRLTAGRFAVEGRVIALKDIAVPLFVVGTETDHIAPWQSVYKTRLFTDCDLTFVLTKGGHNGGILSEPGHKGRHYRISHRPKGALYTGPDTWLAQHAPEPGSWWPEWARWLASRTGDQGPAPQMGAPDKSYPALMAAPGSYVFQP